MTHTLRHAVLGLVFISGMSLNALAQNPFNSGSTNAQGAFPPAAIGTSGYTYLVINMKTGAVESQAINGTVVTTVALSGGASSGDAFPTGEFDFTTFTVPYGTTLLFVPNSVNSPVTIRASGDIVIAGTIDISGKGGSGNSDTGISAGGAGGPGGASGGNGGSPGGNGSIGLGVKGGAGGVKGSSTGTGEHGGGGGFPHSNPNLIPLIGGSGGGGAASSHFRSSGSGGGGGGGVIMLASSTKIAIPGTVNASGGGGGVYGGAAAGGGGAGGGVRLIANRIETSGSVSAEGGRGGDCCDASDVRGANGIIRVEAIDLSQVGGTMKPPGISGLPGVLKPSNLPRLRITSIGGVTVPDVGAGAAGTVDVQVPAAGSNVTPANPMAIVMNAAYIPDGTTVTVSIKTSGSQAATATATLTNGAATVNMTVPSGFSYIQASTGTFTLTAELQQTLPLIGGERILQAAVEFDGVVQHTSFFTESGIRVGAARLFPSP